MNFTIQTRVFAAIASLLLLTSGCSQKTESAPVEKTGRQIVDGMRLKQLTKGLQLTEEQQNQVKPILEMESKQIEAVNADSALSMEQRVNRYKELRAETYNKIKTLLTAEQLPQLDGVMAQLEGRKKKR